MKHHAQDLLIISNLGGSADYIYSFAIVLDVPATEKAEKRVHAICHLRSRLDATALRRGVSHLMLLVVTLGGKREPLRHKAVASAITFQLYSVAPSVSLHGTRPWHH
jgi:hypothetical protein